MWTKTSSPIGPIPATSRAGAVTRYPTPPTSTTIVSVPLCVRRPRRVAITRAYPAALRSRDLPSRHHSMALQVAEGDGHRIEGIVGKAVTRVDGGPHHLDHLRLSGLPVPRERSLDLHRCVLPYR